MSRIHLNRIDLNLLTVLHRIHTEGSLTRAAETLNVTQSAVSHTLRRLREILGDPLFVRQGASLVATPLMKSLAGPLHKVLVELEDVINSASDFDLKTSSRRFTLGMDERLEVFALPSLVARSLSQAPDIELRSLKFSMENMESGLASGAMDIAISAGAVVSPSLLCEKVASDTMVVIGRAGHPLLKGGHITLKAYLGAEHISVTGSSVFPSEEELVLTRAGLNRRVRVRTQRYIAASTIVSRSDLLLTMPVLYGRVVNQAAHNTIVALPKQIPTVDYFMHWHTSSANDQGGIWLRDSVMRSFAEPSYAGLFLESTT